MMKLIRMAYLRFLERNCGVTMPSMNRSVITTGNSKTTPKASVNLMTKVHVAGHRDHRLQPLGLAEGHHAWARPGAS